MQMKKREVVCKDCGEKQSIAAQQNTAGGYLCPRCTAKRRKAGKEWAKQCNQN